MTAPDLSAYPELKTYLASGDGTYAKQNASKLLTAETYHLLMQALFAALPPESADHRRLIARYHSLSALAEHLRAGGHPETIFLAQLKESAWGAPTVREDEEGDETKAEFDEEAFQELLEQYDYAAPAPERVELLLRILAQCPQTTEWRSTRADKLEDLGCAYKDLAVAAKNDENPDYVRYLQARIRAYEAALDPDLGYPADDENRSSRTLVHYWLGRAYSDLADTDAALDQQAAHLQTAITHYKAQLEGPDSYSLDANDDRARAQWYLGTTYESLADVELHQRLFHLETAAAHYEATLDGPDSYSATKRSDRNFIRVSLGLLYEDLMEAEIDPLRISTYSNKTIAYQRAVLDETASSVADDHYERVQAQLNLGSSYYALASTDRDQLSLHLETSVAHYEAALTGPDSIDGLKEPGLRAEAHYNAGIAYYELAQAATDRAQLPTYLDKAIAHYEASLALRQRIGKDVSSAETHIGLGDAYNCYHQHELWRRPNDRADAIRHYTECLALAPFDNDAYREGAEKLGNVYYLDATKGEALNQQLYLDAREAYQKANNGAAAQWTANPSETARRKLAAASEEHESRLIHCCLELSHLDSANAATHLSDAVKYALAVKSRSLTEQIGGHRHHLGLESVERKELQTAWEGSDLAPTRAELDRLLVEAGQAQQTYHQTDERLRSQIPTPTTQEHAEAEAVMREADELRTARLAEARPLAGRLYGATWRLLQQFPPHHSARPDAAHLAEPLTGAAACRLARQLSERAGAPITLVEYIRHAAGWGAVVVNADNLHYVELRDENQPLEGDSLNALLGEATNALLDETFWADRDNVPDWSWSVTLNRFYDLLIRPLRPYLPPPGSGQQVVLAPSRILHLVPFQALSYPITEVLGPAPDTYFTPNLPDLRQESRADQDRRRARDQRNSGLPPSAAVRYLSQDYALTFVPSLHALRPLLANYLPSPGRWGLCCIAHPGDPATCGTDFLRAARDEADAIRRIFEREEWPVQPPPRAANRPSHLFAATADQRFDVLHLIGHGVYNFDVPHESALLLADGERLRLNDIRLWLRLHGRPLVTLSACQSNRVGATPHDEALSLAWAFLGAGAGSVVASQWSVRDRPTALLFGQFYRLRMRQQTGRGPRRSDAQLLQEAMAYVRRQNDTYLVNPALWAAFQVNGLPLPV